jgi:hypothetical protein
MWGSQIYSEKIKDFGGCKIIVRLLGLVWKGVRIRKKEV